MQKLSPLSVWLPAFVLFGLALALAAIFEFLGRQRDLKAHAPELIGLVLLAGGLYLAGVCLVENFSAGAASPVTLFIILAAAVLFRLSLLPASPTLSDDVYRYQWEGRVQRAQINPYTVFPASPGLRWLEDSKHPLETGRTVPSLYPPLSEKLFSLVRSVPAYKRLFASLDLASVLLLLLLLRVQKQPLVRVLIYAWNPMVIVSFALDGHHDSLAISLLLAANTFILTHRKALSTAFLGLAFLAKLFPALLVPVFLKRARFGYLWLFATVVVLGYLPYASAGLDLIRGLRDFASGWEANDSAFRLLRLAGNSKAQAELVAGVILLGLVAYALKRKMDPLRAGLFLIAGLLFLSPDAFPWYFTWMIPFLCFCPSPPLLLMSVTCALGYAPVVAYAAGQPYVHSPFILALEYAPVYLWLAHEGWRGAQMPRVETRN